MPAQLVKCPTCSRTVFPNEIKERELFKIIFNSCPTCLAALEGKVKERIDQIAFNGLDYGNQQRLIRERAAVTARSDFDMVDA